MRKTKLIVPSRLRKLFTLFASIILATSMWALTWNYTGSVQSYTVPTTGIYKLQVWGAQGGTFVAKGGLGGYATCYAQLNAGETIYIYVGGRGGDSYNAAGGNGGWNGGGHGGTGVSGYCGSAGGGGATHISKVNNQVIGSGCAFLGGTNYIIVAGGGGGGAHGYTSAGNGGGTTGGLGTRHDGSTAEYAVHVNYTSQYYYSTNRSYGANGGNGAAYSWGCEGAGGGAG